MKVLLASPRRSPYTGEQMSAPHLGLLSLAAVVRAGTLYDTAGTRVDVVDEQLLHLLDPDQVPGAFIDAIPASQAPDIIGVQAVTSGLSGAAAILERARRRFPRVLRVLGGVGAAQADEELVAAGTADVVVRGEAEIALAALVFHHGTTGRRSLSAVPGITYRTDDGAMVRTAMPGPIRNLDALPLPARDLVDMRLYARLSRGRCGNIVTSRGCSYACAYCYARHHWGRGQRRAGIARVIEEIRVLVEEHGVERVRFEDDDFTESSAWVAAICKLLQQTGLSRRMTWEAKGRPEHMEPRLLECMRRAGCTRLLMGVETLSHERLQRVGRPMRTSEIECALRNMQRAGVAVHATVILGLPGERADEMRASLDWLEARLQGPRDLISPSFYTPFFPGIDQTMGRGTGQAIHRGTRHAPGHGLDYAIEILDRDSYTGHVPVTSSAACSYEELMRLYMDTRPDGRGAYRRIAHRAGWNEIQQRIAPGQ